MRLYIDTLQNASGQPLVGATVLVQTYPALANASIYSDNGLTPIANSTVTTGSDGQFAFYVADGVYSLQMSYNGSVYKTQVPVSIIDGAVATVVFLDTGAANAYAVTSSALEKVLRSGMRIWVQIANTNTASNPTFAYNTLAAKTIVNDDGTTVTAGQLVATAIYQFQYNGTSWQIISSSLSPSVIGATLFPPSPLEITNSAVITNYAYQPGDPRRYGGVGNGIADDSVPLQQAALSGVTSLVPGQTYKITQTVTWNYVQVTPGYQALITGTGTVRGVITNTEIPHALFQVPYNIVRQMDRAPVAITANYWVDPLIGNDSNNGTSATTPIATLAHLAALVASVASTASSLTCVLRSGRHEVAVGGLTLSSIHTLTSGGVVTVCANPGEQPIVCPKTYWFFNSSAKTVSYNGVYGVANTVTGAPPILDLWDAQTGLPVPCASNQGVNGNLPRNQVSGGQIPLTGSSSPYTISVTLNADDTAAWNAMTTNEKAGVQFRITQDFTSSWHDNLSLSGSVLSMNAYTNTSAYYNGFGSPLGAPYYLKNAKYYLDGTNFAGYTDNVYLPNFGTNFFTVDNTCSAVMNMTTCGFWTFQNIRFRYQSAPTSFLKQAWAPSPQFSNSAGLNVGLLVGGTAGNIIAQGCFFEYSAYNGFQLCNLNSAAYHCQVNHVGMSGIIYNNLLSAGCAGATVKWNKVRTWGELHLSSAGIYMCGVGITCNRNDVRDGAFQGIHIDSQYVTTGGFVAAVTGNCNNNVIMNIGMPGGVPNDLLAAGDCGCLYTFGGGAGAFNFNINGNVVGPSYVMGFGTSGGRGIMLDGGTNGVSAYGNLVWGQPDAAFLNLQSSSNTYNNSIRNNLFLGSVTMQSTSGNPSDFSNNVVGNSVNSTAGSGNGNIFSGNQIDNTPNVVFTEPNIFGCRGDGGHDYAVLWSDDPAWPLLTSAPISASFAIDPFVLSFLRRGSMTPHNGPTWANNSINAGITAAAYTVLDSDFSIKIGSSAGCVLTLPGSSRGIARELMVMTDNAQAVTASASIVCPNGSNTPGTAILAATAGKWAHLKSDGNGLWYIIANN